ncbi:MAG: oligoendopeptidase F [Candidatus Electryonea clarkiae]|nr:oligoendopeptidase F [Candidatus Electryonea clarkiae]MDP8286905.1 oligoendopeptidase F [Candidatus Electryonea clarkiae]
MFTRQTARFFLKVTTIMIFLSAVTTASGKPDTRNRDEIPDNYKWDLTDIYSDWDEWETGFAKLEPLMDKFASLKGTLSQGAEQVLKTYKLNDELGMLAYKVYRYPQLNFDLDQRNNEIQANLQRVQILFATFGQATAWLDPEMLTIPHETMKEWIDSNEELQTYRFLIEELYRSQEHVLDEKGEQLLSYFNRFNGAPRETYQALSTADIKFKEITLSTGEEVTVSYSQYQAILHTNRNQEDRALAFNAMYEVYEANVNTYAAMYNSLCQRDWARSQARNYDNTLVAALDGNNIPVEVYENLVTSAKSGSGALRRYHELRKKVLKLENYHLYDSGVPIVEFDKTYPYDDVLDMIVESVAPLGKEYQKQMRAGFEGGWIDVYESDGKRSGAYSAGVYGIHPFMLLNYNDTLTEVFTLAHEMGHTMHTVLSQANQPFATADYTIFVAEVASTLNEALLLEYMLDRTKDPLERAVLLQHAIDSIVGTFYSQVLFADYEREAHRLAEEGRPITSDVLGDLYYGLLKDYYGDSIELDELYKITWARIPHFYRSPYYVYQYATCFASSAQIVKSITEGKKKERKAATEQYLTLLKSGGNDHPMEQLKKAGVDLSQPETVQAVVDKLDGLVTMLEQEIEKLEKD